MNKFKIFLFIILLVQIQCVFPSRINAENAKNMGERIRRSNQFSDMPSFQKEIAVAVLRKAESLVPLITEFRKEFNELRRYDQHVFRRFSDQVESAILPVQQKEALDILIQYYLASVENKLDHLFTKCEAEEKRLYGVADRTKISDAEFIQTLGRLNIQYDQTIKLYDYRQLLVANIFALSRKIESNEPLKFSPNESMESMLRKRISLADPVFEKKLRIDEEEKISRLAIMLLERTLGNEEIRKEVNHYRDMSEKIKNLESRQTEASTTSREILSQVENLVTGRLESLAQFTAPNEFDATTSAHSKLLYPVMEKSGELKNPLLHEWDHIREELVQSNKMKGIKLALLLPALKNRNALMSRMMSNSSGLLAEKGTLLAFLLKSEDEWLKQFRQAWETTRQGAPQGRDKLSIEKQKRYYEKMVDLGLIMEAFMSFEIQILNEINPMVGHIVKLLKTGENLSAPAISDVEQLKTYLLTTQQDLSEFESFVNKEEGLWLRFEKLLQKIMEARQIVWERLRSQATAVSHLDHHKSLLINNLRNLLALKASEVKDDHKRFRDVREAGKTDPSFRILFGNPKYKEWESYAKFGNYLGQVLTEIAHEKSISDNLAIILSPMQLSNTYGLALVHLIQPLNIPWDIQKKNGGVKLLIDINGQILGIDKLEESKIHIEIAEAGEIKLIGTDVMASLDFVIHSSPIGELLLTRNFKNRFSNQIWEKGSIYSYAILGTVAVVGGIVAGPAVAVGCGIAAAINLAADTSVAGGNAWIDTGQQVGITSSADAKLGHERIETAERWYNYLSIANGVVQARSAYKTWKELGEAGASANLATKQSNLRNADDGFRAAQDCVRSVRASEKAAEQAAGKPFRNLAERALARGDLAEWDRLTNVAIKAETGLTAQADRVAGAVKQANVAEQNLANAIKEVGEAERILKDANKMMPTLGGTSQATQEVLNQAEFISSAADVAGDATPVTIDKLSAEKNQQNELTAGADRSPIKSPTTSTPIPSVTPTAEGETTENTAGTKTRQEQDAEAFQQLQAIKNLTKNQQQKADETPVDKGTVSPDDPEKPPVDPLVEPTDGDGNKESGEPGSVTTGVTPNQGSDQSDGTKDTTVDQTTPMTGTDPDLASQLRDAENQTNLGAQAGAQPSGGGADSLQMALNTNMTGSAQQTFRQQLQQEAQQVWVSIGGTQAERAATAQNQQMIDQSRVQAQGQQTGQAIAANAQEVATAQQTLQVTRQNSLGNILLDSLMGGFTSGVAVGIDRFGSIVGSAAGQQSSGNWGIQPLPPPVTNSPPQTETGSTGSQTGGAQTGSTSQTSTSTTAVTSPTSGAGSTGSGTGSGMRTTTQTASTSSGGTTQISRPPVKPPATGGTKSCRVAGTCRYTGFADKNGCCTKCGKRVAKK